MALKLHRDGLVTIMNTVTAAASLKFAAGYEFPTLMQGDPSIKYPFWCTETAQPGSRPFMDTVSSGGGGVNHQVVVTRILMVEKIPTTKARYDAFLDTYEAALTALQKDSNISLGQAASGCVRNEIVSDVIQTLRETTPPLVIGIITCRAEYQVTRT